MARRQRNRVRSRRTSDAPRHVAAVRPERESASPRPAAHRAGRAGRTGFSRAAGAASQSLERAAVLERGFIQRDFRRLALVVGIALVLLVVAGLLESALIK